MNPSSEAERSVVEQPTAFDEAIATFVEESKAGECATGILFTEKNHQKVVSTLVMILSQLDLSKFVLTMGKHQGSGNAFIRCIVDQNLEEAIEMGIQQIKKDPLSFFLYISDAIYSTRPAPPSKPKFSKRTKQVIAGFTAATLVGIVALCTTSFAGRDKSYARESGQQSSEKPAHSPTDNGSEEGLASGIPQTEDLHK